MGPWALPEMRTGRGGWKGREGNLLVARLEGASFQAAVATLARCAPHTSHAAAWRRKEALRSFGRPMGEGEEDPPMGGGEACILKEGLDCIGGPLSQRPPSTSGPPILFSPLLSLRRPLVRPPASVCRGLPACLAATACRVGGGVGVGGVGGGGEFAWQGIRLWLGCDVALRSSPETRKICIHIFSTNHYICIYLMPAAVGVRKKASYTFRSRSLMTIRRKQRRPCRSPHPRPQDPLHLSTGFF